MKKKVFYIIANSFYNLSVGKYIGYIESKIVKTQWFKDGIKDKNIKVKYLSRQFNSKTKYKNSYVNISNNSIKYSHKLLLVYFTYSHLPNNKHLKLLHINIKNQAIYNFSKLLFMMQKKFIDTGCFLDLKYISRDEIKALYNTRYDNYIDKTIISKIFKNTFVSIDNQKHNLSILLPKQSYLYSLYIKDIINTNPTKISDTTVAKIINKRYNTSLNRRNICYIRQRYLIPPLFKRQDFSFYFYNQKLYSQYHLLSKEIVSNLSYSTQGIYELSTNHNLYYPQTKSKIIYIGSSNDIKKRVSSYATNNAHTYKLKEFILQNKLYFRYIKTKQYKEYEKLFLDAFKDMSGELPKFNVQNVL